MAIDQKSETLMVMIADDDDDFRAVVVSTLRAEGHSTVEARDGQELVEALERFRGGAPSLRPDVLVTDVKMPKLSGFGVLEALRCARWNLAVVVMTALSHESIDALARRLGAAEVLHKPFDPDALLTAVRNAIGHANA
jgi:CheY-like chemotaxis protein